jgi:hypothetical protein
MDMSNKSLALLLVAAIVISLGGALISLNKLNEMGTTGMASYFGSVQATINSNISCNVDTNVSFGTGYVLANTTISSDKANSGGFNDCTAASCTGMTVNNSGNVNVNVTFNCSTTGSSLLAGQTGANDNQFQWEVRNGTATSNGADGTLGGCSSGGLNASVYKVWQIINSSVIPICANLTYAGGKRVITFEYNLTIMPDLPVGAKTAYITIACAQTSTP